MKWLVDNHFDLVDAEYAINEGGGHAYNIGGHWLFTCQTAEKGVCWTRVLGHGTPGHASAPPENTAVQKLLAAMNRLAQARMPQHRVATVESYVRTIAALMPSPAQEKVLGMFDPETEQEALAALPVKDLANGIRASLRNTATPTVLKAGEKINVVPSVAEANVDCRVLPGQDEQSAQAEMRSFLGDEVEIETILYSPPTESGFQTPMFDIMKEVMNELEPGSMVAPYMSTGGTDGRFLAVKGVKVYGFCPLRIQPGEPGMMALAHAHDERVSVENMDFSTRALWQIVRRLCVR
jgi:acetylornithine deacetylase/succinyl-diaminopimelate desuccinylase-like protein